MSRKVYLKKEIEETPVNQLILETAYLLQDKKDEKVINKLEEWGLIEAQGKRKRRVKKFTPKGIKRALNISLSMEDESENPKEKGGENR